MAVRIRVLGIDPGLASVGWGVVETDGARLFYRGHGCIATKAGTDVALRLGLIRDTLTTIIAEQEPAEVAMESLFFSRNVTSALGVAEARGIIRLVCLDAGLSMREYGPMEIKRAASGSGGSGKVEIQSFVRIVLGLPEIPKPDHAADALAVAICHCQSRAFLSLAKPEHRRI
ncbi:MAG: crossover junction endodeoxyribonuclease RuvC [Spirochaetota bacterium]